MCNCVLQVGKQRINKPGLLDMSDGYFMGESSIVILKGMFKGGVCIVGCVKLG